MAVRNADMCPRVLLVGPSISGAGAEKHFRLIAENVFVGSTHTAVFQADDLDTLLSDVPPLDLGWKGARTYTAMIWRLRRYLKQHDFDALLAFGFYPIAVSWAAVQGLRRRPALILTEINSPRQESLETRGTIRRSIMDALRRLIYRRADLYAANSEDGVTGAIRYFGVDPERARRIPNLVEPERLERLAARGDFPNQTEDALTISIVGRLFHRKRVDTLLQAAAGLPFELPWRIDVVGDGEDRPALEALAHKLGIAEQVQFHGWLDNPYPGISRATVSVLCSEFEGFSNSVLEAMALRTPVITSMSTTDARDMCTQGAALGFPVGDHSALGAQLIRVLESQALQERLSAKAWAYAQRHTVPLAIREYEALILDAIGQHKAKGAVSSRVVP